MYVKKHTKPNFFNKSITINEFINSTLHLLRTFPKSTVTHNVKITNGIYAGLNSITHVN